jgi:hypothetical protein
MRQVSPALFEREVSTPSNSRRTVSARPARIAKHLQNCKSAILLALAALGAATIVDSVLAPATVEANSIAINLTGPPISPNPSPVDLMSSGGYVNQNNWNNLTPGSYQDYNGGYYNGGNLSSVVDSTGATVTGMTVAAGGSGYLTYNASNTIANPSANTYIDTGQEWGLPDPTMHDGFYNGTPELTVTNIPYAQYSIYAYVGAGYNGGQGSGTLSVANGVTGAVNPNTEYYDFYGTTYPGPYYVSTDTSLAQAVAASEPGQILLFTRNTASAFTLDWNGSVPGNTGDTTGLAGIQIVDTSPAPEPASAALISVASLAMLGRRRRKTPDHLGY